MNTYQLIRANFGAIKKAHAITRAIRHALRLQILEILQAEGKATVTEIYVKLRLEQSVCSQHLAILRKAGLTKTVREGKFIYYSINEEQVEGILQTFSLLCKN